VPQSKDSEVLMGLQMHQGILTTRSIRRNAFVLHRNAIIWGSFDSADSPLRGGSAPLRMTAALLRMTVALLMMTPLNQDDSADL
jgi:hypothetical protein